MDTIIFDTELKIKIIERALKKEINQEGNIIDKVSNQEVLSPAGNTVNVEDFGGFENGSEIFIKNDIVSLMDYSNN